MADKQLAVLRLGKLGDLVMVEPALRWAAACEGLGVTLVTDSHYASTFARLLEGVEVKTTLEHPDLVLDLHRVHRSRLLRRGRPWVGVAKEDIRRRLLVRAPALGVRPKRSWPERHLEAMSRALARLGVDAPPPPPAAPRLRAPRAPLSRRLGLVLGAGWPTKRWPARHWEGLASGWRGEVVAFVGPGEEGLAAEAGLRAWPDTSLDGLVEGLSSCEVVVSGDTGPLHLAGALGCRVVGLFGPTSTETGFWVWQEQGQALRVGDLSCSPCSLHGSDVCPRGHHRCLEDLQPAAVVDALA